MSAIIEREIEASTVSYKSMARGANQHGEGMWTTNRHCVDERIPREPDVRVSDPKFDTGIFPGFERR